jgi:uncharacterized membrane protein
MSRTAYDEVATEPRHDAAPRGRLAPSGPRRGWWGLALAGGLLGVLTATAQTVERIAWAKDPLAGSICDVNAKLSCTAVFGEWQSSALGIPNSLVAVPVFSIVAAAAFAGLTGSRLSRGFLATVYGLTLFMTGFVTWYMAESAFSMKVLCLYCTGCAVNILLAAVGLTRVVDAQHALGDGRAGRAVHVLVRSGSDLIVWAGLAVAIATTLVLGLT